MPNGIHVRVNIYAMVGSISYLGKVLSSLDNLLG